MSSQQINGIDDVKNLFSSAAQDDEISQAASQIIINGLNDTNLAGCVGEDVDNLESDDITVVSIILDASVSMDDNEQAVRDSYDSLIKDLQDSKQSSNMLVSTRTFATRQNILYGFKKVDEVDAIGNQYRANGGSTKLFDTVLDAMTGIRAYAKQLNDNGIRTRCIVAVISDGDDNDSVRASADDIKQLSNEFLKSEMFYLAYIGYGPDLKYIAAEIGFPNIITTSSTPSEVRKTMGLLSKSIIRASQTQVGSNSFFSK